MLRVGNRFVLGVTGAAVLATLLLPLTAWAASLETTVTPVGGSVPVSLDASSVAAVVEGLRAEPLAVEVTNEPTAAAVSAVEVVGFLDVSPGEWRLALTVGGWLLGLVTARLVAGVWSHA